MNATALTILSAWATIAGPLSTLTLGVALLCFACVDCLKHRKGE